MKGVFDVKAFIGKQEENHAEYQVEPEWRQVMHSPSIDIFSSEPARVGNQGDQRAPDPGIKIEQSIEQFIDEFTEFKRVCITFLSAVGAVVVVVKGSIAGLQCSLGFGGISWYMWSLFLRKWCVSQLLPGPLTHDHPQISQC